MTDTSVHSIEERLVASVELWGIIIKEQVSARRYYSNDDIRRSVENAFTNITPELLKQMSERTWRRIQLCFKDNDEHTDTLDV